MLRSYFFIPADKPKFLNNMFNIDCDEFVIDLEDAVADKNYDIAIDSLKGLKSKDHYIRPKLFDNNDSPTFSLIGDILDLGFKKFITPKIKTKKQWFELERFIKSSVSDFSEISVIFLVEHPMALFEIKDILNETQINIKGLAIGSHDYASSIGMKHSLENLYFVRMQVLNIAKAYGIEVIDIANMDIVDQSGLETEIGSAFSMGFDAKFFIHPKQLETLKKYSFYSSFEITTALKLQSYLEEKDISEFSVVEIDGKVYEKPHLSYFKKVINWHKKL